MLDEEAARKIKTWANSLKRQPCRAEPARLGILYGSRSHAGRGSAARNEKPRGPDGWWMLGMLTPDLRSRESSASLWWMAMIPNGNPFLGPR